MPLAGNHIHDPHLVSPITHPEMIRRLLADDGPGLVRFRCSDEASFCALSKELGSIWRHRDSDSRGVTAIEDRADGGSLGYQGFTANALQWHTDSAGYPEPPRLILLWCSENRADGGESLVASASSIDESLRHGDPELRAWLHSDSAATFYSGKERYTGPILRGEGNEVRVRLRLDELGHFAYPVARKLDTLMSVVEDAGNTFRLVQGDGYALRNDRWLHARRSFRGARRLLRIMVS